MARNARLALAEQAAPVRRPTAPSTAAAQDAQPRRIGQRLEKRGELEVPGSRDKDIRKSLYASMKEGPEPKLFASATNDDCVDARNINISDRWA
jgi:hypothetical protein